MYIPNELKKLNSILTKKLYLVGGYIRDCLLGYDVKKPDFDICSATHYDELIEKAKEIGFCVEAVYGTTGTVKLKYENLSYEFSSFRTDVYRDKHSPSKVVFTDDIYVDAIRRDFTINAIYYDIGEEKIVDILGGVEDLKKKTINCTRDAKSVFSEDGLRLMRLARFCGELGLMPSQECMKGARENASLIENIVPERIYNELNAILHADTKHNIEFGHFEGLKVLFESGVLQYILPELTLGDKMPQRKDYHDFDVLMHTLHVVKFSKPNIRFSALLHDVAKPKCFIEYGNFYSHEIEGAIIAEKFCEKLKMPKKQEKRICRLVELHMYDLNCATKEKKVRKKIVENYDILEDLLDLKQADYSGCKCDLSVAPTVKKWQKIIE